MPRLTLRFEDRVLKQCALGLITTIGRLPDNNVIIDNPAVSSHHACVFRDGDHFVVEDLNSTNGTFVNQTRVTRQALRSDDVILVGKHTLVFDQTGGEAVPEEVKPLLPRFDQTVFLDTAQHRALLNQLKDPGAHAGSAADARPTPGETGAPDKVGVLRVLGGRTDRPAYTLRAHTSIIGKSDAALVRLRGWFKPQAALAIARSGGGYVAAVLGGTTLVNSQPLTGRCKLEEGDILRVCGLTLQFTLTE